MLRIINKILYSKIGVKAFKVWEGMRLDQGAKSYFVINDK